MNKPEIAGVRHLVAVASGKGGVGKSTVAASLALAIAASGRRTGLLDADIYGPSQGMLMGVPEGTRPEVRDNWLQPVMANGVQCMSMAFVTTDKTPAVWRGPMASGALQQLMTQTAWDDVEVLIVDMPPGTGDIQLTLAQQAPVSGAVIVTTPQDLALLDARKGVEMFRKVQVPVFGIVENMSTHRCSKCGFEEALFGTGGGDRIAAEYDVPVLGRLPLSMAFRSASGAPALPVRDDPDGDAAQTFAAVARSICAVLDRGPENAGPVFSVVED